MIVILLLIPLSIIIAAGFLPRSSGRPFGPIRGHLHPSMRLLLEEKREEPGKPAQPAATAASSAKSQPGSKE